jgi:hypothetical protein
VTVSIDGVGEASKDSGSENPVGEPGCGGEERLKVGSI